MTNLHFLGGNIKLDHSAGMEIKTEFLVSEYLAKIPIDKMNSNWIGSKQLKELIMHLVWLDLDDDKLYLNCERFLELAKQSNHHLGELINRRQDECKIYIDKVALSYLKKDVSNRYKDQFGLDVYMDYLHYPYKWSHYSGHKAMRTKPKRFPKYFTEFLQTKNPIQA